MSSQPLILAVDDEAGIRRLINLELTSQGFRVITAENGADALRLADEHRPDLVLLDIVMPDMSGLEVMRELRNRKQVSIILLTAKGSESDRVKGLEMGADDYLPKPFSPQEMTARVRAVLRRAIGAPSGDHMVRADDIEIDLNQRKVLRSGEPVSLTRTEWMLLQHLAANAGKIMLNAELLTKVWGPQYRDDLQYLRVWVSRLRHKLETNPSSPRLIKTFAGIGYMFNSGEDDVAAQDAPEAAPEAVAPEAEAATV